MAILTLVRILMWDRKHRELICVILASVFTQYTIENFSKGMIHSLQLGKENLLFINEIGEQGGMSFVCIRGKFILSTATFKIIGLHILVIYHILPCKQFQGNAKVNKLGIINYAHKLRCGGKLLLMDTLLY